MALVVLESSYYQAQRSLNMKQNYKTNTHWDGLQFEQLFEQF